MTGKPFHPPFPWYYSGWTREGFPKAAFGIKQLVYSPATHNNDSIERDTISEEVNPGLSVQGNHTIGLTTFPVESMYSTEINHGVSEYNSLPVIDEYQDVKNFFARPRLVASGVMDPARTTLSYLDVREPISDYWPAAAKNRLNGVFGYRCAIKFTVTAAATPFQQGVVAAAFHYGASFNNPNMSFPRRFPALVTNLPHARLNLADQTMCELTVPYLSPYEFFELENTAGAGGDNEGRLYSYGQFLLSQILPYATLTTAAPQWKIYISLHDMELFGAVPVAVSTVVPQSGLKARKVNDVAKAQDAETKPKGGKYISTAGKVVTGGALLGALGGAIAGNPQFSEKCLKSAVIANSVSKTAESMGYSKPVDQVAPEKVMPTETSDEWHVDMASNARVVGPFQSNKLVIDGDNSGTHVDEMDFDFVLGRYAQAFIGSMNTADVAGTVLYATNLCPTSMWFRSKPNARPGGNLALPASGPLTANCFLPTALCYVSQMFKYWRGSIKFRFTFAKTRFHAGRVLASFVPATFDTIASGVLSNQVPAPEIGGGFVQPFQYSTIFDLRDDSTFEFEVPYVSSRPFISTLGSVGGVTLSVLDPLLTTGESATAITYMVEVCAGDDYQLANFIGSGLSPATSYNPDELVAFQSGLVDEGVEVYTSGERFNSVKQLAMIPYSVRFLLPTTASSITSLPPFYYQPILVAAIPMPATTSVFCACSTQNVVSRMYVYCSGSTTYGYYGGLTNGVTGSFLQNTYDSNNPLPAASDTRNKTGAHKPRVIKTGYNGTMVAKAPSYQKFSIMPVDSYFQANFAPGINTVNGNKFAPATYGLEIRNPLGTASDSVITYAAGDDARFMAYRGPPPCWLLQSTQTANLDSSAYGNWN